MASTKNNSPRRWHSMKIRVYYEDTDCGGVVYYANYLRYMERSRTELLRDRGIELVYYHNMGFLFAVVEAHIKYRRSAKYDDILEVKSRIAKLCSVSISFETCINNGLDQQLVTATVKLACISPEGKVRRIPKEILEALG